MISQSVEVVGNGGIVNENEGEKKETNAEGEAIAVEDKEENKAEDGVQPIAKSELERVKQE